MTDSTQVEFIPATVHDLPDLADMMPGVYAYEGERPDSTGWAAAAAELIQTPSLGGLWMIHWQGQPVGYVALTFGFSLEFYGRTATIDELFVAAPYRSHGIGGQAIEFVEAYARSLGFHSLMLEVDTANTRGQSFYESRGFQYYPHMHIMNKQLFQ
jgi:GNAT superfamily N-acetyltransferase